MTKRFEVILTVQLRFPVYPEYVNVFVPQNCMRLDSNRIGKMDEKHIALLFPIHNSFNLIPYFCRLYWEGNG